MVSLMDAELVPEKEPIIIEKTEHPLTKKFGINDLWKIRKFQKLSSTHHSQIY